MLSLINSQWNAIQSEISFYIHQYGKNWNSDNTKCWQLLYTGDGYR